MALYDNVERFFLDAATNLKERENFQVKPVSSLKLMCIWNTFHASSFIILLKAIPHF